MIQHFSGIGYGIIWDMDGVITDSADAHYYAWKKVLTDLHIDFSRKEFSDTFGINNYNLITRFIHPTPPDSKIHEISLQKEIIYRDRIKNDLRIYPGAREILQTCQAFGFKQALDSSAPIENIDVVLDFGNLRSFFDQIVSTDHLPAKNFPDAYLAASSALDLSPEKCLVVEDSLLGIKGVKKAGMKCIAIASTHPRERLQGADLIVPAIDQLDIGTIKKLIGL